MILRNIGVEYADEVAGAWPAYVATRRAGAEHMVGGKKKIDRPARGQTISRELGALKRQIPGFSPDKVRRDPKDQRRAGKRWPVDLVHAWLDMLHQDARDEALLCALTGLRAAEAKRIELGWVERAGDGWVLRVPERGAKTRTERMVGLDAAAAAIIGRRATAEDERRKESGDTRPRPVVILSPSDFRSARKTAAKHLGYPAPPTLRDLRHTAASIALERTADPGAVMRSLGHRDLRTTELYVSTTLERIAGVAAAVGEAYAGPDHPTGAPEVHGELSMARDRRFELLAFGFGGHADPHKWLRNLAAAYEAERERTRGCEAAPDHQTGSPAPVRRRA